MKSVARTVWRNLKYLIPHFVLQHGSYLVRLIVEIEIEELDNDLFNLQRSARN